MHFTGGHQKTNINNNHNIVFSAWSDIFCINILNKVQIDIMREHCVQFAIRITVQNKKKIFWKCIFQLCWFPGQNYEID